MTGSGSARELTPLRLAATGPRLGRTDDPWKARVLAVTLLVGALGSGAALVARGEPWPPMGPAVVLVVLVGIAINRGAFFPTEFVATAEAAVLFAAVVAFRRDAPLLGALAIALAVGTLDSVHWRQRAFVRMAYNSGSQGLAILVGALVFRELSGELGASLIAVIGAAAIAAVPYALADSLFGAALLLARGDPSVRDAVRHQWPLNGLAVPLACSGAVAGYLATSVGWWLALLVLAPLPWVPELVLVRARRLRGATTRTQTRILGTCVVVSAFAAASGLAWSAKAVALPLLVAVAVVLGLELRVSSARAVPPLGALVVVAAAVVGGHDAFVMAALVAATTTATAWALERSARVGRASWAIVIAGLAGLGCGAVVTAVSVHPNSATAVGVAVAGAALYEAVAIIASRRRVELAMSAAWTAPLALVAALLAIAWDTLGVTGSLLFALGLGGAIIGVAWSAAPPWGSRALGPWAGSDARARARLRVALCTLAVAAASVATAATQASERSANVVLALVAAAVTASVVAMALAAVRQWRFAPRPRARAGSGLLAIACLVGVVYLPLAFDRDTVSVAVLAGLLAATVGIAWPVAQLADRVGAGVAAPEDQRMPESRNASE